MINITAKNIEGNATTVTIDKIPDSCPLCKTSISPKFYSETCFLKGEYGLSNWEVDAVFRCTSHKCLRLFIATYKADPMGQASARPFLQLCYTAPIRHTPFVFKKEISSLSKDFCEIYNEAKFAEEFGLKQVCGVGYRKALEFLIKDYAIENKPTEKEVIKKMFLGECIKTYIEDANVKSCAELATWLGNDEAHYEKRWIDKDLNDLKVLIDLTINWIVNVKLTNEYKARMKSTTKP